jgi:hypothetical protein
MNIFYLDKDPQVAAQFHCDKHVVKMILESAQLLSTAHRIIDGQLIAGKTKTGRNAKRWILNDSRETVLYQAGHVNHPSAVWVRANVDHYRWLHDLLYFLIGEYKYRYNDKDHACQKLQNELLNSPINIPNIGWQEPPQAMPDECKVPGDSVQAYKNYYMMHKRSMASWKRRGQPSWYK